MCRPIGPRIQNGLVHCEESSLLLLALDGLLDITVLRAGRLLKIRAHEEVEEECEERLLNASAKRSRGWSVFGAVQPLYRAALKIAILTNMYMVLT